ALINEARNLRQRMDEILDRLGWTFPVYVLFTKCDLISGFADYFSSLSPVERHQVWGALYRLEPEGDQRAAERFSEHFDTLLANLRNMRVRRMASVSRSEEWGRAFMFPEEFANLKNRMSLVIETLFEANPYRKDLPLFRGTYYSSGKQEGKPFDLVVQKIQSMLGAGAEIDQTEEQEEKFDAYFVRDLFAKVLKSDQGLVRMTGAAARRRSRLALLASAGFLTIGVLACIWIGISYGRLRARMDRTKAVAEEVSKQVRAGTLVEDLERMEYLRQRITGSWRSFPLIVTDSVHQTARGIYHRAISDRILKPVEENIARDLRSPSNLYGRQVRQALRAELMLLMPTKKDSIGWNARALSEGLQEYGLADYEVDDTARRNLENLVEEFLRLERPLPDVNRDSELQRGARRLSDIHSAREFFRDIVYEATQDGWDQTLDDLLPDQSIFSSDRTIRAAFTRNGWENTVRELIQDTHTTVAADNQLIHLARGDLTEQPPAREDLLESYHDAYIDEWVDFIESIHFRKSYGNCSELGPDLRRLRGNSSLLSQLLRGAADHSYLESGSPGNLGQDNEQIERIDSYLRPLRNLVEASEDESPPLDEFISELKYVYDQVDICAGDQQQQIDYNTLRSAGLVLDDLSDTYRGNHMASALTTFLKRPLTLAKAVFEKEDRGRIDRKNREAVDDLQTEWSIGYTLFSDKLSRSYPFDPTGPDADPLDVTALFGPNGTLAEFSRFLEQSLVSEGRGASNTLSLAEKLGRELNITDDSFRARFTLQSQAVRSTGSETGADNLKQIDQVVLTINGHRLVDRLVRTKDTFTWHSDDADPHSSLVLEGGGQEIASIEKDTIWCLCRLFDEAVIAETDEGRLVTWSFPAQGIEVDFLLTTREDFFIEGSAFRTFKIPHGVR
ncbi:MAG: type VI secretion protein IcmF/TssM N-terminal domain-containing protein, partial [bacterium]